MSAELNAFPVRVLRGGSWRGIDLTLAKGADGLVRPIEPNVPVELSGGGAGSALARVHNGAQDVSMSWPDVLPAPVLQGSTATYPEVWPGVDLMVKASVEGFSTFVVVKTPQAARDPRLSKLVYGLSGTATTVRALGKRTLMVSGDGVPRFEMAHAMMWDSRGLTAAVVNTPAGRTAPGGAARTAPIELSSNGSRIEVTPDKTMLTSPDSVFPVVIDPTISTYTESIRYAVVRDDGVERYDSGFDAQVGYQGWSAPYFKARTFYAFPLSGKGGASGTITVPFEGRYIKSATFMVKTIHSPNNTCSLTSYGPYVGVASTGPISTSTVWGGPSGLVAAATTRPAPHGNSTLCTGYDVENWDVTTALRSTLNGSATEFTLRMMSMGETDRDGWRKFQNDATLKYPRLVVTYSFYPAVPTDIAVAGGTPGTTPTYSTVSTPTFGAKVGMTSSNNVTVGTTGSVTVSDPVLQLVKARFELFKGTTRVATGDGAVVNAGSTSTAQTLYVWSGGSYSVNYQDGSTGNVASPTATPYVLADGDYTIKVWGKTTLEDGTILSSTMASPAVRSFTVDTVKPDSASVTITPLNASGLVDGYPTFAQDGVATFGLTTSDPSVAQLCYRVLTLPVAKTCVPVTPNLEINVPTATGGLVPGIHTLEVFPVDRAGNEAPSPRQLAFKVLETPASDRWALNTGTMWANEVAGRVALTPSGEVTLSSTSGLGPFSPAVDAAHFGATGQVGGATAGNNLVSTAGAYSVSAWVRPTSNTLTGLQFAVSQEAPNYDGLYLGTQSGVPVFGGRSDDTSSATLLFAKGTTPLVADRWYHLVGVADPWAKTFTLYVASPDPNNPTAPVTPSQYTYAYTGTPLTAAGAFVVGRGRSGGLDSHVWQGWVRQVRVFQVRVSQAQRSILTGEF